MVRPFLILLLLAALTLDYRRFPGSEYIKFQNSQTLIEDGTWKLDRFAGGLGVDKARFEGHWYSAKSIGDTLLAIPATWLTKKVIHSENTQFYATRLLSGILVIVLGLVILFRSHPMAFWIGLLGSPAWYYWRFTHSDLVAAGFILLAFYQIHRSSFWWAGIAFGAATLVRYPSAAVVAVYVAYLIITAKGSLQSCLKVLLPFAGSCLVIAWINHSLFGYPWRFSTFYFAPLHESHYETIPTAINTNPALQVRLGWDFLKNAWGLILICPWLLLVKLQDRRWAGLGLGGLAWLTYYLCLPNSNFETIVRYFTGPALLLATCVSLPHRGPARTLAWLMIGWSVFRGIIYQEWATWQTHRFVPLITKDIHWLYPVYWIVTLAFLWALFKQQKKA